MWSYLDEENTSRAAEFMTDWGCWRRYDGMQPEYYVLFTHSQGRIRRGWGQLRRNFYSAAA